MKRDTPAASQVKQSKQKIPKPVTHHVAPTSAPKSALSSEVVRKNAASKFKECLEIAVKEATEPLGERVDILSIANTIEEECHKQTGAQLARLHRIHATKSD